MVYESFAKFMGSICCFTSYVSSIQGFPKPLSKEEEQIWVEKLSCGDEKAREVLINHNLRLVAHIVKKYSNSLEADDLISVGTIGLIKAVDSFKGNKGVLLSTYASRCIENEILMLIRANKKHKDTLSLNSILSPKSDSDDMELANLIPAESEEEVFSQVERQVLMEDIEKYMEKNLSHMEQEILKYRYGIMGYPQKTQKEVADIFNISRSYISRIESKILKILQKNMSKSTKKPG
ncbi:MAG: sigma-70 family RNA polymerase sigma factor [Clostridia bacterium]|nr:sigma-70 family RNA polymerase sigma factor [Clostridia bacterium]MBQ8792432.1 sigma-70 family RNA polymerase sigma factor [Clostridia bacterium]